MKKLGIAILTAVFFCGCDEPQKDEDGSYKFDEHGEIKLDYATRIRKVYIEGHEYLFLGGDNRGGICHSGTCQCRGKIKQHL